MRVLMDKALVVPEAFLTSQTLEIFLEISLVTFSEAVEAADVEEVVHDHVWVKIFRPVLK